MENWYLVYNGKQVGPMTKEQMLAYGLAPDTMVWREGLPQWTEAYNMPELMKMIKDDRDKNQAPPIAPSAPTHTLHHHEPASGKDKTAAGVLAILLGGLGIQYFYVGKVAGGFLTILLSIVTCGLWSILMLVQGILMLTMSQQEFDQKYVYSDSTLPLF